MAETEEVMTPQEITAAAQTIVAELTDEQRDYARQESARRSAAGESANTAFSCLHDLMDANELLPPEVINWDTNGGPDFSDANAIMEAVNTQIKSDAPASWRAEMRL